MAPPTIIAHKSTFISTQTLHLSQPLEPSAAWRRNNENEGSGLPARAVEDAIYRLNHVLAQHARRAYAPQASRHVAEQIEGLFHRHNHDRHAEEDGVGVGVGEEEEDDGRRGLSLRVGMDFTTDEAIASLPSTWDQSPTSSTSPDPLEAKRYAELASTLSSLSARRKSVRDRVDRLRRMRDLLAPFITTDTDGTDAGGNKVQQNLITRNGDIERELERMRLLLVRVAGRVAALPDPDPEDKEGGDVMDIDFDALERDKITRLLDGL
ncbi:kinetochore Sim4 complex subunit Fta4 [Xylariaceae sp. FL0594]|nr:kinetochore Sim4 complex subunit Fta4 [Xylariaceae sp. FL0594]